SFLTELRTHGGHVTAAARAGLAARTFGRVAEYDAAIAAAFRPSPDAPDPFPETLLLHREPIRLRYGENPHQRAAIFAPSPGAGTGFCARPFEVLKGEPPSYTNLLDLETALNAVAEFPLPAAAVVKHATPCGVAEGATLAEALERAIATDPVARFGCAIAVNRPLGPDDPRTLHGVFVDLLAAPATRPRGARGPRPAPEAQAPPDRSARPGRTPLGGAHAPFGRVLVQDGRRRR
ncbi:bifunctional phosphoribosylaminoimidazolecarboxamide formyltransferase/IMP cyclohydrolase, partial [mine drainage metagenome]